MIKTKKNNLHLYALFILVFLIKTFIAIIQNPIQVSDEVWTLAPLALLSGKEWPFVFSTYVYYGPGFVILLLPLFILIENPFVLYRSLLVASVLCEAISSLIIFRICVKHLKLETKYSFLVSLALSFCQHRAVTFINNESIINLLLWCVLLVLLDLYIEQNKRKKSYRTLLLMFLIAYAYLVHVRLMALVLIVGLIVVLIYVFKKKCIVSVPVVLCSSVLLFLSSFLSKTIQNLFASYRDNSYIHNSVDSIASGLPNQIKEVFSKDGIQGFIGIFFGQMNAANIITGGVFTISTLLAVYLFFRLISLLKRKQCISEKLILVCIISCYGFVGFFGMLTMQSITWIFNATTTLALGQGTTINDNNFSRVFVYLRYAFPYAQFMILALFAYNNEVKNYTKRVISTFSVIIVVLLQLFWVRLYLPYVYNINGSQTTLKKVFLAFSFKPFDSQSSWNTYVPATIVTIILVFVFILLFKNNKMKMMLIIMILLLVYQYLYYGLVHENDWQYRCDNGYEFIVELDKRVDLESEIVVNYNPTAFSYQFMLKDYSIYTDIPSEDYDGIIICSSHNLNQSQLIYGQLGYKCFMIDENEYVFARSEDILLAINEIGLEQIKFDK